MQFTPQQLSGGPKFSPVTRIGNWYEELALDEAKAKNFDKKTAGGNSLLRRFQAKIKLFSQIVPLSYSSDGALRFGYSIILQHDASQSVLACDTFEEVEVGQEKYLVTTVAEVPTPKARNTFKLIRPPKQLTNPEDDPKDPILRIGQPFMIGCNESLLVDNNSKLLSPMLYLTSTKKNERASTKRTSRPLVYMSANLDADSIWMVVLPSRGKINGSERLLAIGQPVTNMDGFQITHRQTNMYLTCDPSIKASTEFGLEYECFTDRSPAPGKLGIIVSEFSGSSTSQTLTKPDAPTFSWHFLLSEDPSSASDNRSLPSTATIGLIIQEAREQVLSRGISSFLSLRSYLQKLEVQIVGKGKFDTEDLKNALMKWGIDLKPKYLNILIDSVDKSKIGLVDYKDLLDVLRGPFPAAREDILYDIFKSLDTSNAKLVPMDVLRSRFNGQHHPLVTMGGYTESEVMEMMIKTFQLNGKPLKAVDFAKFVDYYADISAAIDDDSFFEGMVRSNWNM